MRGDYVGRYDGDIDKLVPRDDREGMRCKVEYKRVTEQDTVSFHGQANRRQRKIRHGHATAYSAWTASPI